MGLKLNAFLVFFARFIFLLNLFEKKKGEIISVKTVAAKRPFAEEKEN